MTTKEQYDLNISLHSNQAKVYLDKSRFIVLAAGRRFGKTMLALTVIITEALRIRGRYWYIAPTYRQAEMIAWKQLLEMIPPKLIRRKNDVKLEIDLFNGSEICLKGSDNEDTLKGVGLRKVVLDEYAFMKPNVWQEIVRPMLTDVQGTALFIGTPKGKNHFYELFNLGLRKEDDFSSYQFKTVDNPFIKPKEIESARKHMNERFFKQEYEASFEDFSGLIWPEFDYNKHVVDPFYIPEHYERIGAIDPAITGTTAALFSAVDEDGGLIVTGEYYEQNKRVSEISESIRGKANVWYCDPSGNRKTIQRNGTLYSFFDEFADNGIYPSNAQNDVNAGINRVAEYFRTGKIRIFRNCVNLISEIEQYHWVEDRESILGVSEPKPFKSYDHCVDCLRYSVMSRIKTDSKVKPITFEKHQEMQIKPFENFKEEPVEAEIGAVYLD